MNKVETITVLLVDDHELILEGYKNVLSNLDMPNIKLTIDTANNCDTAWEKLKTETYQIVILDINFPVNENSQFLSGEDLGISIKKDFPDTKIVILTVLEDAFRIKNLLTHISPAGFLLKGETTSEELMRCLEKVITAPPYFGSKIAKLLQSQIAQDSSIDGIDRKILYQLSLGTTTKNLPQYVHLSLRAIEDRKRKLKELFGVNEKGNRALLEKAREGGYI